MEFIKKHSYSAVGLFVKQIAISIFGLVLAIACHQISETVKVVSSVCAIIFYLFLIYAAIWEVGSKDKFGIEYGKIKPQPLTGLYIGLIASIPNFLLAILATLGILIADGGVFSTIGAIGSSGALFIEGMYTGLLSVNVGGAPLNTLWFMYFLIPLPAIGISTLAYYLGSKGIHFTKILIEENPEDAEVKRQKKKSRRDNE
ncbi:MAG: hypothetical protein ACI3XI_09215 [Eubacteriales bacterium]